MNETEHGVGSTENLGTYLGLELLHQPPEEGPQGEEL